MNHCPFGGKIIYPSKRDARRAAKTLGRGREVYRCPACQHWHITSRPASAAQMNFKAKLTHTTSEARKEFKRKARRLAEMEMG